MAKPISALELHYPMIQFFKKIIITVARTSTDGDLSTTAMHPFFWFRRTVRAFTHI